MLLFNAVTTSPIVAPARPFWNEWLVFDLCIRDLRRESRLSATFVAYNDRKDIALPLGGVSMALFDHTDALVSGVHKKRLWFNKAANHAIDVDHVARDIQLAVKFNRKFVE